ncbi:MAG: hypothetical protein A2295_03450 [Candidatus Jacksonbacteria bacterium RIFOXYB2_FULL_44_15]|nr:MAG: hypothetical protein A2295_03450 [Candidatus Jacksonbacteria bacterium RIFOXYB2_FULL_44_15]
MFSSQQYSSVTAKFSKIKIFWWCGSFLALLFFCLIFSRYLIAQIIPDLAGAGGDEDAVNEEINSLNQNLGTRRQEIEELKRQAEIYRQKIAQERSEAFTLKSQLSILNTQIAKMKIEIKVKQQEIELTRLDISETERKIAGLQKNIAYKKQQISEILRLVYQNDEKSYLEILLMNDSLSEFFNAAKYVENLHAGLHDKLADLKQNKEELDSNVLSLQEKQKVLENQKSDLEDQKYKLEQRQLVKKQLLDDTQESERRFKDQLTGLRSDQEAINSEIVDMEKRLRAKLAEQEEAKALSNLKNQKFIWPVPQNTITAYFHDPNYPYRYIFEHPAVDIRAAQGTKVSAAATGYVAKAKRDTNCRGAYAYVMLIHADGLSTVYGHLSRINVNEGDLVLQGQQIGLSGAMPGTCGAGRLTTGPHLHFEVRMNGIPTDPLNYLP